MPYFEVEITGIPLAFHTQEGLFSPHGPDAGTLAMIECADVAFGQAVLDLGCGYGIVGVWAAKRGAQVYMTDIDSEAVSCASRNLELNGTAAELVCADGLAGVDRAGFDWILCNPPYHADYTVAKRFIEKGFNRLKIGGRMALVVKRPLWYRKKLEAIFGGARTVESGGYTVLTAEKRSAQYANKSR